MNRYDDDSSERDEADHWRRLRDAQLSTVLSAKAEPPKAKAEPPKTREFAVLLPGDRKADFRVPPDFSADDFELVKAVLDVMRPGLVSTAPPHTVPDSPDTVG